MTDQLAAKTSPQDMLDAVDAFMSGAKLTDDQRELEKAVTTAGAFAVCAYETHAPKSGGECHAMARAFLLALIDPTHPDLDYLRADPSSGLVARDAAAALRAIAGEAAE